MLKIDRAFVRDISTDRDDAAIVKTIVALAHALELGVIAEGVETEDQLRFLAQLNCDLYQGYYFSKPVPAGDIVKLLEV
jgi:EAL domain-containing protein (putative c-di-GMP-specific phosphodiesterase class I)